MLQQKRNDITPVQSRSAMIASAAAGAATAAEPCVRPGHRHATRRGCC
jgi:hypothetical protein